MKKSMEVFFASNDAYSQHLGVTIASILSNASSEDEFNFYVLDSGILKENKNKIINLKKIKDFNIEFVNIEYIEELPDCLHVSKDGNSRIKIPAMFPQLEKALYLDCDIVVKSSLSPLWNTDIKDYYIAAALDLMNYIATSNEFAANRIKIITMSLNNYYFNSGVLLLNLRKLREFDLEKKFIKFGTENADILRYIDQDIFNGLFVNKVKFIDQCWNYDQRFERALNLEPKIIHFTTEQKPWVTQTGMFSTEYQKYLKLTDFAKN